MADEWKVDADGVHLCPDCWPEDEDAATWPSVTVDPEDEVQCENCGRSEGPVNDLIRCARGLQSDGHLLRGHEGTSDVCRLEPCIGARLVIERVEGTR